MVIEQMVQIRPSTGQLSIRDIKFAENHVWIQIGLTGHMTGDIVFWIKRIGCIADYFCDDGRLCNH